MQCEAAKKKRKALKIRNLQKDEYEIPALLALLKIFCSNDAYWETKTRIGKKPKGIAEIETILNNYCNNNRDRLCSYHPSDQLFFEEWKTIFAHLYNFNSTSPDSSRSALLHIKNSACKNYVQEQYESIYSFFVGRDISLNRFYGQLMLVGTNLNENTQLTPKDLISYLKENFTDALLPKHFMGTYPKNVF